MSICLFMLVVLGLCVGGDKEKLAPSSQNAVCVGIIPRMVFQAQLMGDCPSIHPAEAEAGGWRS